MRRTPLKTMTPELEESKEEVGVSEVVEEAEEQTSQHVAETTQESVQEEGNVVEAEEQPLAENVGGSGIKGQSTEAELVGTYNESAVDALEREKLGSSEVNVVPLDNEVPDSGIGRDEGEKEENERIELRDGEDKEQLDVNVNELKMVDTEPVQEFDVDKRMEGEEKVDLGEDVDEELPENAADDSAEQTKALEEEDRALKAIVNERKNRKEREVFVGGLDRDAAEEDVRKVFEKMGEIVEIRLHKSSSTNKNKGYAFVEYAKKESARRALAEMKNPVVRIYTTFPLFIVYL